MLNLIFFNVNRLDLIPLAVIQMQELVEGRGPINALSLDTQDFLT